MRIYRHLAPPGWPRHPDQFLHRNPQQLGLFPQHGVFAVQQFLEELLQQVYGLHKVFTGRIAADIPFLKRNDNFSHGSNLLWVFIPLLTGIREEVTGRDFARHAALN
jgi:hypothetical protein